MDQSFGKTFRELREAARVTLRAVAKHMGWSPAYVSDIERGRRTPPTNQNITKMAKAINVEPRPLIILAETERSAKVILYSETIDQKETALTLSKAWPHLTKQDLQDIKLITQPRDPENP